MGKKKVMIKEIPVLEMEKFQKLDDTDEHDEAHLKSVFSTVLVFSLAMFSAPILTYFLTKSYIFADFFHYDNNTCTIYAAISAVLMVHAIIGIFIYVAWDDGMDKKKKMKSTREPTQMNRDQSSNTFAKMLFSTVMMVICPIALYFASNSYFSLSENKTYYSVFASVACAHIILILMIVTAFRDKPNYKLD